MSLIVQTAHYRYSGPHRCDVTRKSAPRELEPFAPPGALLGWGLRMRREGERRLDAARALPEGDKRERSIAEARSFADFAWRSYEARYVEAMRSSYKMRRVAWDRLLARETAVLVCFCGDPVRCHRRVLASILAKLGASDLGELDPATTPADWWKRAARRQEAGA